MLFCNLFFLTPFPSPYFPSVAAFFQRLLLLLQVLGKKKALRKWKKTFSFRCREHFSLKRYWKKVESLFYFRTTRSPNFFDMTHLRMKTESWSFFCIARRSWMSIFQDNKSTILVEKLNRFLKMIFLFSHFHSRSLNCFYEEIG